MTVANADKNKVVIRCAACSASYRIARQFLGKSIKCTKCGGRFKAEEAGSGPVPKLDGESKIDARIGANLGAFKITGILGQGGMGTVYEAEDTLLLRKVAIKVLPPSVVAQGTETRDRFLREARSAGALEHPNIVSIYQVGCEGGVYYIAMQLVRGGSASDFLREHGPMTPHDATRVVLESAKALAAAHRHGLIHRDIKPANILLGPDWTIKVADFGLAKTQESEITSPGGVMGTPSYLSPEACRGDKIDFRSDLYSLGATYYCLLTGHPPFQGENTPAIMFKHVYEPVPDPRTERPGIPADCVSILMRALSKDVDQRYQTAEEVIADLSALDFSNSVNAPGGYEEMQSWAAFVAATQGELAGDAAPGVGRAATVPIPAMDRTRPVPAMGSTTTMSRRVPTRRNDAAGLYLWAGSGLAVLLALLVFVVLRGGDDPKEKDKTPIKTDKTPDNPDSLIRLPPPPDPDPDPVVKTPKIDDPPPKADPVAEEYQRLYAAATGAFDRKDSAGLKKALDDLRKFQSRYASAAEARHREFAAAARSEIERLGRTTPSPATYVRSVRSTLGSGKTGSSFHADEVVAVAFAPGPDMVLASASRDGTSRLWRRTADDRWSISTLKAHVGPVNSVAFSRDGKLLVTAGRDGTARIWDVALRKNTVVLGDAAELLCAVFAPESGAVVTGGADGRVKVWDAATRENRTAAVDNFGRALCVAYSADGRSIAAGGIDRSVRLIDPISLSLRFHLTGHTAPVTCVQFSPDGRTLASVGGEVKLWNALDGRELHTFPGAHFAAFARDGRSLAVGGPEPKIWNPTDGTEIGAVSGEGNAARSAAFSPDGRMLVFAGGNYGAGQPHPLRMAYAIGDPVGPIFTVPAPTGGPMIEPVHTMRGPVGQIGGIIFSPDGARLLTRPGYTTGTPPPARLWDVAGERLLASIELPVTFGATAQTVNAVFSPDGKTLAVALGTAAKPGEAALYDAADGKLISSRATHVGGAWSIKYSPDGKTLAVLGGDQDKLGELKLFPSDLKAARNALQGHVGGVRSFEFSPDGRHLCTLGEARNRMVEVKIWDVASGKERKAPPQSDNGVFSAEFTADGSLVVILGRDGKVRLWSVAGERVERESVLAGERLTSGMVAPFGRAAVGLIYHMEGPAMRSYEARMTGTFPQADFGVVATATSFMSFGFSPDGRLLALLCNDRAEFGKPVVARLRLLDAATGKERPLPETGGALYALPHFSPDGSLLANTGSDRVIRLIETKAPRIRAIADPARGAAVSVSPPAFSRDGKWMAVGTSHGSVQVYAVPATAPAIREGD